MGEPPMSGGAGISGPPMGGPDPTAGPAPLAQGCGLPGAAVGGKLFLPPAALFRMEPRLGAAIPPDCRFVTRPCIWKLET